MRKINIFSCFKFLIVGGALSLMLVSCKNDNAIDEKKVEQIIGDGNEYQDLIRNPVSASRPMDTINIARAEFEEIGHDFGDIKQGSVVHHTFKFKNIGKIPLVIKDATSTCGCTVPDVPKDPIPPGGSGEIKVKFNSENKEGFQNKPVTVLTNGYPSTYTLKVIANIIK